MKKLLLFFLVLLSACALVPKKVEMVPWPTHINAMEGEGDLDLAWGKEKYSGSFALKMAYPQVLILEVYGAFGQTLVYVKKEGNQFLVVAGDEKSTDERLLEERFGLNARNLIDDLAMKGQRQEGPEGLFIQRESYRVVYSQGTRDRRVICWKGNQGHICLTFGDLTIVE